MIIGECLSKDIDSDSSSSCGRVLIKKPIGIWLIGSLPFSGEHLSATPNDFRGNTFFGLGRVAGSGAEGENIIRYFQRTNPNNQAEERVQRCIRGVYRYERYRASSCNAQRNGGLLLPNYIFLKTSIINHLININQIFDP